MLDGLRRGLQLTGALLRGGRRSRRTLALLLQNRAHSKDGERPFLLFGDRRYSYAEANARINRHAHAYAALGIGRGDTVALVLDNRPEFLWHFLAAGKLGAIASLINTHNTGEPLLHSLRICEPKLVITGSEHAPAVEELASRLAPEIAIRLDVDPDGPSHGSRFEPFGPLLDAQSDADPDDAGSLQLGEQAAYIYTSGTTGFPKAAKVRHGRLYGIGNTFGVMGYDLGPGDVLYNCLPLYHTSGIGVGTSAVITRGATLALARRFSATHFWSDVRRYEATAFVYIGELCRYLLAQPERPEEREHRVRVVVGNGLRPDIWPEFQRRFGIERVREFYGSTEGNAGSMNLDGTVGSVGRMWPGSVLVKWNEDAGDFERDEKGCLIRCARGEPGILLGRIRRIASFDGYQDPSETEKKIVRNAFKRGDAWFNTGDLLRVDARRRLYFVDRVGDTFRWKGENVSTFEVQEQIAALPGVVEVNVYGVQVPGSEGRAGMAALVLSQPFDADAFRAHVDVCLPSYARPLFLRVSQGLQVTSTFKLKKAELRTEGFDPSKVSDPLYFRDPSTSKYAPLTAELFDAIVSQRLKV